MLTKDPVGNGNHSNGSSTTGINGDIKNGIHNHPTNNSTTNNANANNKTIPYLCRYWCFMSKTFVPKYVPITITLFQLDITFTLLSAIFLGCIRYISEYMILVAIFHWPSNTYVTKNAAGSLAAMFHSIQLVPSLYVCFQSTTHIPTIRYNPSHHMKDMVLESHDTKTSSRSSSSTTTWYYDTVDALLQFCTGYMIYDSVLNILFMKQQMLGTPISSEDYLFLGHHLATILYMSSTRYLQQGHQSAMICMLLGECTNPFHNLYYVAIAAQDLPCCNGPVSQFLYRYIELIFACSYVVVRTMIAPVMLIHVTYNLWTTGRRASYHRIPLVLLILWTILIWGVVFGSIPWIMECYTMIQKYYNDPSLLLYMSSSVDHSTPVTVDVGMKTEL